MGRRDNQVGRRDRGNNRGHRGGNRSDSHYHGDKPRQGGRGRGGQRGRGNRGGKWRNDRFEKVDPKERLEKRLEQGLERYFNQDVDVRKQKLDQKLEQYHKKALEETGAVSEIKPETN